MKKRIGILTSGGDCPGLNATIRGVAKACYEKFGEDVQIVGIEDGYYGLINNMCKEMKQSDFSALLFHNGEKKACLPAQQHTELFRRICHES